ncbi:hypothetical protein [Ferrimonas marina]|uniref:Uncharacterized protein n=1 Tax=Ferrimonas marina TaxID=299255 RepID=A0A1M5NAW6_9GAMM|nr:hypothetical protein [Ferrimonas marina]SHG86670.1 hypothetical protein SAMN02745129_0966 [Ferrimonas marina]
MSMKSAKEFAIWMIDRFSDHPQGVYLEREDLKVLSGRQTLRQDFIADVHFELTRHGMGFVTDTLKEKYFLFFLPEQYWKKVADRYSQPIAPNVHDLDSAPRLRRTEVG